jgi:micrococcal nuclease
VGQEGFTEFKEASALRVNEMLTFKEQEDYPSDAPPRWTIGVNRQHVAIYVAVALVAGFAIGFIAARSMTRNKEMLPSVPPGPPPATAQTRAASTALPGTEFHKVTRILRGDTIDIETVGPVRMIGIESLDGKPPRETYAKVGQDALNFVEKSLLNQDVRLEFDPINAPHNNKDDAGQTLAYVYTRDGTFINSEMLRQGLAFVRSEDFQMSSDFRGQESDAMKSMRGVWGSTSPAATAPPGSSTTATALPPDPTSPTGKSPKLAPLPPSAIGPNIPAVTGTTPTMTTPNEPMVLVSPDDKLYHKAGCELLGKKKITMPLSQIKAKGYTACSRCYPATVMKAP